MSKQRTRVYHLIKGLGRGGAERLLAEMLPFIDADRYEHSFSYFFAWKDAFVPLLEARGASPHCFRARNTVECLTMVPAVARHVRVTGADIIHCHMPIASVVGRLAGRLTKTPVVSTEHNLFERYHPLTRFASIRTWQMQRAVVAVSEEVRDSIVRHVGQGVPVTVVRNGIPVGAFERDALAGATVRSDIGVSPEEVLVGTMAVFRQQKRLDVWLDVAKLVLRQHPQVRFLLVGDGPLRRQVEERVARLGLGPFVKLVGLQEEVAPFLSAMDIYMMTSDFEGLPLALLEAMASRLPVVVTAVGGIPEVVHSGREGLICAPRDRECLARSVGDLVSDRGLREELANNGYERVLSKFGMARMVAELEAQYAAVVSVRR